MNCKLLDLFFHYSENSATAVYTVCRVQQNRFICFVMRDQALVAQLLDVGIAVNNKDTDYPPGESVGKRPAEIL